MLGPGGPTTTTYHSKPARATPTKTLVISTQAYLKGLALGDVSSIEWSGYGPQVRLGDDKWELKDFYYLSENDNGSETNLSAEATAEAWNRTIKSGIEITPGIRLAWIHCHPTGGAYWSGTDETAINDSLRMQGNPDAEQVSVLFATGNKIIARYDTLKSSEDLIVEVDYGSFKEDVALAAKRQSECKYQPTTVGRAWYPYAGYTDLDAFVDQALADEAAEAEAEDVLAKATAFAESAVEAASTVEGAIAEAVGSTGDYKTRYDYHCDICEASVERNDRPLKCSECDFWICEKHVYFTADDGSKVCQVCGDPEFAKNLLEGEYGLCSDCERPIIKETYVDSKSGSALCKRCAAKELLLAAEPGKCALCDRDIGVGHICQRCLSMFPGTLREEIIKAHPQDDMSVAERIDEWNMGDGRYLL